ncbi:MAG TPA: hypothetical protein VE990_14400 [Acidimicrobiales bacterium]|nr:hypothetical protein [Acidimicrobiales bacterium]
MGEWFTIEVLNGSSSARPWYEAYGDLLVGIAVSNGALEWDWQQHPWGCLLELEFPSETEWERFRAFPAVAAALDAVPDPVNGLIVHPGRGGSSGSRWPRRPRPLAGSGSAALPEPEDDRSDSDEEKSPTVLIRPA